ncbi:hypothetical protein P280DRAFT_416305 [Massarina eburnea CBS 473.64]|uniref:Rhodopsin domain-containing protein n=1 Tax=Massarina eburnea CBS 473.64 TaxID=1395130 RepID=A0A6A6SK38_9PLEO|nr:hypothetical protein P280DRAFT_416305 [Massarina eburnea CBS 473.64]
MTARFPTAMEIASWPDPNYVDPPTRRPLALGINITMTVIVVVFVMCRYFSRTVLVPALGLDDWTMLLASICAVANNIMIIVSMDRMYKMGWHMWDMETSLLFGTIKAAQMGMAAQLLVSVIAGMTKVSILLTYLRIFPTKTSKWFCWVMLVYTITLSFACFWLVLFQCSPVATYWKIFNYFLTAKCLNVKAIYYFYTGQNTLSDFLIFLWPAKELVAVKISPRQRYTLISMFCVGVVICIAGLVRVYYTHLYLTHFDTFWNGGILLVICSLETSLAIACGCLPGCKPLMSRLFPRVFGTTVSRDNSNARPSNSFFSPKYLSSSSGTAHSQSFQLQSLDSQHAEGVIVKQQEFSVKRMDAGLAKSHMPRRQSKVSVGRLVRRGEERLGDGEGSDDDSQEFIILQGRPSTEDEKYRPWRWV